MLPKQYRLTKKKDFELIFKKGKSIKEGPFILKYIKNNLSESRFGFVVSKKISTKATQRNTLKRRLRAVVAKSVGLVKKPTDVVVLTLPGAERKTFLEIQEIINRVLPHV